MAWFATLYLAFLLSIGWSSIRGSARRHGAAATSMEIATSIAWPLLVAAFFWPSVAARLGRWVLPLFALAILWTGYTWWRDIRPSVARSDLPPLQHKVAYALTTIAGAAIVVPVVVLGAIVVRRAW